MPGTARLGRSAAAVNTVNPPSNTVESVEVDNAETTAAGDKESVEETNKSTEAQLDEMKDDNVEAEGEKGMTVDLEIKDDTVSQAQNKGKETVEVMIEGVAGSVEKADVETTEQKEEKHIPTSDSDSKGDTEDMNKLDSKEGLGELAITKEETGVATLKEKASDTTEVTEAKADIDDMTGLKIEKHPELSAESNQAKEATETCSDPVTPTKDQSVTDTKASPAPNSSPEVTKTNVSDQEPTFGRPFPASLAKLHNLTVNIGPIRQMDLKSDKLHEILKLSENFEIKFELREKKDSGGKIVQEKSGFVRLPFEITTPTFLTRVAYRLGNLHIDGRDMSVKFPEAFNKAVAECKEYIEENRKIRSEKYEMKKRQIAVKNVPPNVTEDTIRSLFPEAQKITLNTEELPDGGNKVGSVQLDFDTEEACIQCLDTNKDVFIEDCQLKIFRLYSEKKPRARSQLFTRGQHLSRGRGLGRGRGAAQRGNFQVAKIKNRALGFGGVSRGRGGTGKRGGFGRKPVGAVQSSPQTSIKSPGAVGTQKTSPRGPGSSGRGQRKRSFSGSKPGGNFQSPGNYETPFKGFSQPNRETNRGRQRTRPGRGRGKQGYDKRSEERAASFRREQPRQSPYRTDRSSPYRSTSSYRSDQKYSSPSTSREEDPMAMMEYLKSTIARMEEKMSGRDYGDRGYDDRHVEQSRSSQYSPRGRGSPTRGRGRGRGDQNRKRPADTRDYGQEPKRQYMGDQGRRDTRNDYYDSQQNVTTAERRDSIGRAVGQTLNDYRQRDSADHGGSYGGSYGSSYSGNQHGDYGNRSGGYGDSGNRNRRDNYSGRSEGFNTGYSRGGSQFGRGGGGGGRGQSRGRGYSKGDKQGYSW